MAWWLETRKNAELDERKILTVIEERGNSARQRAVDQDTGGRGPDWRRALKSQLPLMQYGGGCAGPLVEKDEQTFAELRK